MFNLEYEPQYEPSEADKIMEEAKKRLYETIKTQQSEHFAGIAKRCERLEEENFNLRAVINGVEERERRVLNAETELKKKAAKMPVKDFFGQHAAIMWKAGYRYDNGEKCDKCDDRRFIQYKTPLGHEKEERCDCYKSEKVYEPEEYALTELRRNGRDGALLFWFKPYNESDGDGFSSGVLVKSVFSGQPFEELEKYNTYFNNEDDCQAYCDWLNNDSQLITS